MRNVSRSCEILPITRKPFCVRNTVYSSLNSGAPLDSVHWMKKYPRSCPETVSATFRKSSVLADFQLYCSRKVLSILKNFSSPTTCRSMFITEAPLEPVSAHNSGEKSSSRADWMMGTLSMVSDSTITS